MQPRTGLLLVGHGTRSERGQAEFLQAAELVARLVPQTPVMPCYLELAEPTIADALARLAQYDCPRVVVLPLLLFAAGHAKEDIPAAVRAAAKMYPQLQLCFAEPIGCHERLLRLSARRYWEVTEAEEEDQISPQDTLWLMVGRGNRDDEALAEMERFVQKRLLHTPVGQVRIAYLAMAEPRLEQALGEIAELRFRRVVVQPHLLFHGELLETISTQVAEMARRWPAQRWVVAPHLGAADLLAEALAERFWEAL